MKKKFNKDPEFVFKLPTSASVLSEIEENDGEKTYQDQKFNNFTQAKDYIQNHASDIVSKIITCFNAYFTNIYKQNELHSDKPSEEGDKIIFDVCMALDCCVWPNITPDGDLKPLSNQLKSFKNLFSRYCNMDVFKNITWQALPDGFIDIVHYANRYFSIIDCNPVELWSKLMSIGKKQTQLEGSLSNCRNLFMCAVFICHIGAFF